VHKIFNAKKFSHPSRLGHYNVTDELQTDGSCHKANVT